jgi:hypothetical protein
MATTSQSLAFAVVVLLNLPSVLFADMGPSFNVTPRFRFENLSDYPEYDFYLLYGHGGGNPYGSSFLTKVPRGVSFPLEGTGSKMTEVTLVALPSGRIPPPAKTGQDRTNVKDLLSLLLKSDNKVLVSGRLEWDDGRVMVYRVGIADKQLGATLVKTEREWGVWTWGDLCCGIPVGVATSVAIVSFGLWFVWRRRKKQKA